MKKAFAVLILCIAVGGIVGQRKSYILVQQESKSEEISSLLDESKVPTPVVNDRAGDSRTSPHVGSSETRKQYRARALIALNDYLVQQNVVERMNKNQVTDGEREYVGRILSKITQLKAEEIQEELDQINREVNNLLASRRSK